MYISVWLDNIFTIRNNLNLERNEVKVSPFAGYLRVCYYVKCLSTS